MDTAAQSGEARFVAYVESLAQVLGHVDRAQPLRDYCSGLLTPGERKSVGPMAAAVAPSRVSAEHQSLLHFVGQASWSGDAVLGRVRELVLPEIEAQGGPIEAWIVDDTGFAKKGVNSVGVARQYCGRLGKLRWRIERDYEELKSELRLALFERRGWRGFHHHATLRIVAYGCLIHEERRFPLRRRATRKTSPFQASATKRSRQSDPSVASRI